MINNILYKYKDLVYNKDNYLPIKNEVNCNGFVCLLSNTYNKFCKSFYINSEISLIKSQNKLKDYFLIVDFKNRDKNDIILFKENGKKSYNHIGFLLNKNEIINIKDTNGVIIENIDFYIFTNHSFLILRDKNRSKES